MEDGKKVFDIKDSCRGFGELCRTTNWYFQKSETMSFQENTYQKRLLTLGKFVLLKIYQLYFGVVDNRNNRNHRRRATTMVWSESRVQTSLLYTFRFLFYCNFAFIFIAIRRNRNKIKSEKYITSLSVLGIRTKPSQ